MEENTNYEYQLDKELATVTTQTLDLLYSDPQFQDACLLYFFLVKTAKWQCASQIYATGKYCYTCLHWGKDRFYKARTQLKSLGLIEDVSPKDEGNKFVKHYTLIKFVWKSTIPETRIVATIPENQTLVASPQMLNVTKNMLNVTLPPLKEKTLSPSKSVDFLKSPPSDYVEKLSLEYSIPEAFILEEKDKCLNYLAYKGKKYKDYNLFFRNWVRNSWSRVPDWKKLPPKQNRPNDWEWTAEGWNYWEDGRIVKQGKTEQELSDYLKPKGINYLPRKIVPKDVPVFRPPTPEEIEEQIRKGERKIWDF